MNITPQQRNKAPWKKLHPSNTTTITTTPKNTHTLLQIPTPEQLNTHSHYCKTPTFLFLKLENIDTTTDTPQLTPPSLLHQKKYRHTTNSHTTDESTQHPQPLLQHKNATHLNIYPCRWKIQTYPERSNIPHSRYNTCQVIHRCCSRMLSGTQRQ